MKIVGNHTVRLAACPGLPWRPGRSAGDSACIFVYPLFRGLGKTRDNPRHDILAIDVGNTRLKWALYDAHRPGAALIAHGAEFLDHIDRLAESSWAQLPVPTRMLGCVVAGDAAKRRVQSRWSKWCAGTWSRNGWCRRPKRRGSPTATTTLRAWVQTAGWRWWARATMCWPGARHGRWWW